MSLGPKDHTRAARSVNGRHYPLHQYRFHRRQLVQPAMLWTK
ncbi:hypothetical protein T07_6098 [Trichinella nelsoni]|uniref:Uncharacterized protein n=1 Tax=Trichinella nelsoni TaxID=6336 RepID=A0A0V0RC30_9BILA|nr:hypothetical protein T07_6098 [Trichinella nelsoni]